MKKTGRFVFLAVLILALALTACSKRADAAEDGVAINYGSSELYTQADMDAAVALIRAEFDTWTGCELHSIRYAGDECNSAENVEWMNELSDTQGITQCIEFLSDFHTPAEGFDAFNADEEYTDWQWYLGRTDGGDWELLTWGY